MSKSLFLVHPKKREKGGKQKIEDNCKAFCVTSKHKKE